MGARLGILFLHHQINEVVENNLRSVRRQNPRATIATMSAGKPLPNGYSLDATPGIKKLHSQLPDRSSDWLVCSWFAQRREQCQKWWIIEWDVFCATSVRSHYRPVWKFPFVASSVLHPAREPDWRWFALSKELPEKYQSSVLGAVPFLYLVSDRALKRICRTMLEDPFLGANGELRFGTVANWCGFPPCAFSPPKDCILWAQWAFVPKRKGIYHSVKHVVTQKSSKKGK